MNSKEKLYARLQRSKNLPSLPQVLLQLIEICDRDDFYLSELSRIITKDASISSRVLTLVNSAYFGLQSTFMNLDQAVVYLGADTIKNIAVTASVQQVFSKLQKKSHLSMSRFWWDSFSSAIYAKRIAGQTGYANVEEAYMAGLLHDLGELLLWMNFTEKCVAVQGVAENKTEQCKIEEEQIGINHCEAGAWLVKQWKLNPFIADTVLYHHAPLEQVKSAFPLVKIVYLAEQCCQAGEDDFAAVYETGRELFDLKAEQLDEVYAGVEEEIREVAENLGIQVKPPVEKSDVQAAAEGEHERDLLHQVKNYSLLHGFLENLVQAESRDAIFKAIEQALNILFDIETIFFFLHDFEQQKLYGSASTLNRYADQMQSLVLSAEEDTSLLVKSMQDKQPIRSLQDADLHLDSLADSQLLDAMGGEGMLYLPMVAQKKSVGVIVIGLPDSPLNDLSSHSDGKLLRLLANQAANSLYLDEVKKQQAEKIQAARLDTASMAAAKVVHEVNNPLAIIRNYLKILEMKLPEKDSLAQEFTILDEEITRIATIIQKLDSFSSPVQHHFELTDVNATLSNLLSILSRSVFYSSRLEVHFSPDPDLPHIKTDGGAIKQIILNLIKNAAEAMKDGGNVYVKTSSGYTDAFGTVHRADEKSDCIEITVQDDGPGIPETILSQLFEPFNSTKGKGHSGLGLSIVSGLVKELQGVVKCKSTQEDGTLFTLTFPGR